MRRLVRGGLVTALALASVGRAGRAQEPGEGEMKRAQVSRAALEDLLRRLDASAQSSVYSSTFRDHARTEAVAVRARLAEGDFQDGDRILLRVDGEQQLTDTFTVGSGKILTLPIVGEVPLAGVLHSELGARLHDAIAKYIKDPIVHARALIRIAVLGEVARPGFYSVPAQTLVTDALMLAGGPSHDAKLNDVRIMRGQERVWAGTALQQAIATGQTLDELSVMAGDRIEVPRRGGGLSALTLFSVLVALPGTIYGMTRVF